MLNSLCVLPYIVTMYVKESLRHPGQKCDESVKIHNEAIVVEYLTTETILIPGELVLGSDILLLRSVTDWAQRWLGGYGYSNLCHVKTGTAL